MKWTPFQMGYLFKGVLSVFRHKKIPASTVTLYAVLKRKIPV